MALSPKEQEALEALQRKAKEPDAPPIGRSVQAIVDFGDQKQIDAAIQHGFLTKAEVEELKSGDGGDDGDDGDEKPKRGGYFKD